MTPPETDHDAGMRLDKWLWAARFFKTRQLAIEAINGGKVQVNDQRAKPGRTIRVGQRIRVHKGSLEWNIEVLGLSRQRRPAPEAALLYAEEEESRLRRQELVRQRREAGEHAAGPATRPNKRERRLIQRFTRKTDE
jgi:ribosome-associated heat shock protein Hsp15